MLLACVAMLGGCGSAQKYPVLGVVPLTAAAGQSTADLAAFHALVPAGTKLEKVASGFDWSEGPIWRKSGGYLLFSDIPKNTIYRWDPRGGLTVFLRPSGYTVPNPPGRELGSNGVKIDRQDRIVMADHGNRQVARLDESNYTKVTLAARYEGKRLNSPNDLIVRSNGDIYFTDPPYGLKGLNRDPAKELDFSGVYRLTPDGALTLLTREITFPNGIAFSPDEKTLYVDNTDGQHPVWMAYPVLPDGSVGPGRVFFDAMPLVRQGQRGSPDGMAVDRQGNIFAAGPGGVIVLSPDGRHLGTIAIAGPVSNVAFGEDGRTLFVTANHDLVRIRTNTQGW
ncbi:MAG TPA: SMP-30/gluconolactonase/LRE family protein [Longimicrobiales bacterium]